MIPLLTGCVSTKGYIGELLPQDKLARIYKADGQRSKKGKQSLQIKEVNGIDLGGAGGNWPLYADVLPGEITIKLKYFSVSWGQSIGLSILAGVGGPVGASMATAEAERLGKKEILKSNVEPGKAYKIMFVSKSYTIDDLDVWLEEVDDYKSK